jgi:hypothetical protein
MEVDNQGRKDDQQKLRYELIAPEIDAALAAVLTYGAMKYEDRNWERGMEWSRPYAALKRHVDAWWAGETQDPETGMPHLWHAACCMMFLVAYECRGTGVDDRPKDKVAPDSMRMFVFEDLLQTAIGRHHGAEAGKDWGDIQTEIENEDIPTEAPAGYTPGERQAVAERSTFKSRINFGPGVDDDNV